MNNEFKLSSETKNYKYHFEYKWCLYFSIISKTIDYNYWWWSNITISLEDEFQEQINNKEIEEYILNKFEDFLNPKLENEYSAQEFVTMIIKYLNDYYYRCIWYSFRWRNESMLWFEIYDNELNWDSAIVNLYTSDDCLESIDKQYIKSYENDDEDKWLSKEEITKELILKQALFIADNAWYNMEWFVYQDPIDEIKLDSQLWK